jgi:hypothetical protein
MKFFIVISGSSMDRKIDFSERFIMIPSYYFFSKNTRKFTLNPYIPVAKEWFLDSGGFSLLSKWSDYPFTVHQYALLIKKKKPDYAAIMDYPCEPELTIALKTAEHSRKNNLSIKERILKTIENTELLFNNYTFNKTKLIPVIQGWTSEDYRYCIDELHNKDLLTDYVAFGSMCRRMKLDVARKFVVKQRLHLAKYVDAKAHYFGFKITFLKDMVISKNVDSFDTAAWTHNHEGARKKKKMYASTQKELIRNYFNYMEKIDRLLEAMSKQTVLEVMYDEEV